MRGLLAVLFAVGCAEAPVTIEEYPCPPGGTALTYPAFGARFLDTHCNTCHSAVEGQRHGAPASFRFDSPAEIQTHRARIFVRAAGSNTTMPPGPDDPDPEEREQLAEWLACGAP